MTSAIMSLLLGVTLVAFVLIIVLLMARQLLTTGRLNSVKNKHVVVSTSVS